MASFTGQKERLQEIKDEMKDLLEEAKNIVRRNADSFAYNRAKSYWIAQISMALDDDHDYVGNAGCNMQETIDAFDEDNDEDEE